MPVTKYITVIVFETYRQKLRRHFSTFSKSNTSHCGQLLQTQPKWLGVLSRSPAVLEIFHIKVTPQVKQNFQLQWWCLEINRLRCGWTSYRCR